MTSPARAYSLYLHIPFCERKCPYCDFTTFAVARVPEEEYVNALLAEFTYQHRVLGLAERPVVTIFFGGGTPSLLSAAAIERILDAVRAACVVRADAEISLEANPAGVAQGRLAGYRRAGVNRLSFGVQSFDAERLRELGRTHTPSDVARSVQHACEAGFENLSIDLIFGVPHQSVKGWRADLAAAVALGVEHISTYALTIEPGTPYFQREQRGLLRLPPEQRVVEMFEITPQILSAHGYERYEISNFARPGYHSRHNTAYWIGSDYVGLGVGAHSLITTYCGERRVSATRWSGVARPEIYLQQAGTPETVAWREHLDGRALSFEYLYLGLRRSVGVSVAQYEQLFGEPLETGYGSALAALIGEGYLEYYRHDISPVGVQDTQQGTSTEVEPTPARAPTHLRLTSKGIRLSDSVFERLVGGKT